MTTITITRPDDWHVHLRDGDVLPDTVRDISRYMGRAIVMPNLIPPVIDTESALSYRDRILANHPTPTFEIYKAKESGHIYAAKLYPAGATTNSAAIEAMQEVGMPLLIHGEVTHNHIDIFDREKTFLETVSLH